MFDSCRDNSTIFNWLTVKTHSECSVIKTGEMCGAASETSRHRWVPPSGSVRLERVELADDRRFHTALFELSLERLERRERVDPVLLRVRDRRHVDERHAVGLAVAHVAYVVGRARADFVEDGADQRRVLLGARF